MQADNAEPDANLSWCAPRAPEMGRTLIAEDTATNVGAMAPAPPRDTPEQSREWSVGDVIARRYQVHGVIVSGMGVVYLCYDQEAHEPVAIKTYRDAPRQVAQPEPAWPPPQRPGPTDTVPTRTALPPPPYPYPPPPVPTRPAGLPVHDVQLLAHLFESEALVWVRLGRHPHIVHARYVLRIGGKPYVFLEFVPGPAGAESSLRRVLREGPVALPTALHLAIQVCAGMEHATRVFPGLVHRDLKPENLLLTADYQLKITDFGLTKVFAEFTNRVGGFAGTPAYASPEQCLGLPRLDTRSDIYALGVILYELLTGTHPFPAGGRPAALFRAHFAEQPVPPHERDPRIPPEVSELVLRCLCKLPEERYPSFTALRETLTACYEAATGSPPRLPATEDEASPEPSVQASVALARALSLAALGRHDEAMLCFDQAVAEDPDFAQAWICKGIALAGLGRFEDAVDCLDRAAVLQPRDLEAWIEKGRALVAVGRREEALLCFDRVIQMHPWHTAALYEKGVTLFFLGRHADAAAYFAEVDRTEPSISVAAARDACLALRSQVWLGGELTSVPPDLDTAASSEGHSWTDAPSGGPDMRT